MSALGALLAAAARALLPAERVGHRVDVPVADGPLQGGPSLSRLVLKLSVLACDNSRLSLTWAAQLTPLTRVLHAGERRRARWRPHGLGAWRASGKVRATLSLRKLGPSLQQELCLKRLAHCVPGARQVQVPGGDRVRVGVRQQLQAAHAGPP